MEAECIYFKAVSSVALQDTYTDKFVYDILKFIQCLTKAIAYFEITEQKYEAKDNCMLWDFVLGYSRFRACF